MLRHVIENKFIREYALLATIKPGMTIEFTFKCANDLYLDLNNSRLHVLVKITEQDETNIDPNTAALINQTLHSMFRQIKLQLKTMSAIRASFTRIAQFWKVCETFARRCKKPTY